MTISQSKKEYLRRIHKVQDYIEANVCDSLSLDEYMAMGDGGNAIVCIPAKDLIVSLASEIVNKPRDIWPLIKNCIIPSVIIR